MCPGLRTAAVALWLVSLSTSGLDTQVLTEARVRIECDSAATTKAWEQFAAACVSDVAEFAGQGATPPRALTIRFGDRAAVADDQRRGAFVLAFAPEDPMEVVAEHLVSALMRRQFADPSAAHPPLMPSTPWLAAALSNRILFGNRERYGHFLPDYEAARFAFQRGCFPEVARLVEAPVPPERTVLFRLYAVHCDLLALCLTDSTDQDAVRRLLELDAHGRPPLESLAFVVQDRLAPGEGTQAWYARAAIDVSRRGRRPSDADSTAERFGELASIPVLAPGERDFRGNRQPLDEVDGGMEHLERDSGARDRLLRELFELLKDAPYLLQAPIARYADACRALGTGHGRSVRNGLRKARQGFAAALDRQHQMDAYLDEQERRFIPAEKRFALPLEVVRRYARSEHDLAPDLHRYLDTVSR